MNVQYLWSAYEILQGNSHVIRGLLESIRHAYGHHLSKVRPAITKLQAGSR